jgi:hypothetical protein
VTSRLGMEKPLTFFYSGYCVGAWLYGAFMPYLQRNVLNVVKSWNGKKDLLLKVNYTDSETKLHSWL